MTLSSSLTVPGWLVTRDRVAEARASIQKLRGKYTAKAVLDQEIDECVAFTELEKKLDGSTSYMECFKGVDARRTFISILLEAGQQLMGIAFIAA